MLLATVAVALAAGLAVAPGDASAARKGSCLVPGVNEACSVWFGRVTWVDDGDTLRVDLDRDGTRTPIKVRVTGINAMEQTVYSSTPSRRRGECHALTATARLEHYLKRSRMRVRLSAQDPESRSAGRWRRSLAVKLGGTWRDVGRRMVSEGHALWLPNKTEWLWNRDYSVLAERASRAGRGIWDRDACGVGPQEHIPISVWSNTDADGDDNDFVNGEWTKIRNRHPSETLSLGGWWLRDSALRRFTFPSYTRLAPGETLTVYNGEGPDSWSEFFWKLRYPIFENSAYRGKSMGDGAYLFDPLGDLRGWMTYPCRENCTVGAWEGALKLSAKPAGRENVKIRNLSAIALPMEQVRLQSPPYTYHFPQDAVLGPGEEMTVWVTGDPAEDDGLTRNWGETGPILDNRGDRVRVVTYNDIELDCYAYGRTSC